MEPTLDSKKNNRSKARAIPLRSDLPHKAASLAEFLREVDRYPQLFQTEYVEYSIHCYEHKWLPFAKEQTAAEPPLHIEWVWLVHMLCPLSYQQDCISTVGEVVDHEVFGSVRKKLRRSRTKKLWERLYGQGHMHWETPDTWIPDGGPYPPSKLSYDIAAAVQRQKSFNYQVGDGDYLNL